MKYLMLSLVLIAAISAHAQTVKRFTDDHPDYARYLSEKAQLPPQDLDEKKIKELKKVDWLGAAYFSAGLPFITGESDSYSGPNPGIGLGAYFPIHVLPNRTELIAGVGYSMQGSKYEEEGYEPGIEEPTPTKGKLRLNYLVVPLTARFNSKTGWYAETGLQPAILLSAKDKGEGGSHSLKDYYSGFDLGVIAEGGYETRSKLGVGLRVVPGLLNINKRTDTYSTEKDRNMVVSLRGSYRF